MIKELDELETYLFNRWTQNYVNFGCDHELEKELENHLANIRNIKQKLIETQGLEEENKDLYFELALADKQYKELSDGCRKQQMLLKLINELIDKHCKIELVDGDTYYQIKIKVVGSDYTFGMSITREEFELLKGLSHYGSRISIYQDRQPMLF